MPKDINLEQDDLDFNSDFKQAMDRLVDGDYDSYIKDKEDKFREKPGDRYTGAGPELIPETEKEKDTSQQAGTAISEGVAEEVEDPLLSNFYVWDSYSNPCLEDALLYADDPCEPAWCHLYPTHECELNFSSLSDEPPPADGEVCYINTITTDSIDTYYSNMLVNCEFWPDLDLMNSDNYNAFGEYPSAGVMGIQVETVSVNYTDEFGEAVSDVLNYFNDSITTTDADYALTYYDVCDYLVEIGAISDTSECSDYCDLVWPVITIDDGNFDHSVGGGYGAPYNMQLQEEEENKIIERYDFNLGTVPAAISAMLGAIGTGQYQESKITDKDLIFRVPNDAFKFGTFDTIGGPMPTVNIPQTGGSSQGGY